MATIPNEFSGVTALTRANVYFEGKVVSHKIELEDGTVKTVGMIYPGSYNFKTAGPERMEIISGTCKVRLAGANEWKTYGEGTFFEVPGNSAFDIETKEGRMEYLCSYL